MKQLEVFTVDDIAKEVGVLKDSIVRFLVYCRNTGAYDAPQGKRGFRNRYEFTQEEKDKVVELFKNKKHGEMAEFNKSYWWGESYRKEKEKKNEQIDK